jgi:hypothetical protein
MAQARKSTSESAAVPKERATFKALLAKNPNYFGNLEKVASKPVKKIVADTSYEQLTCVGFNPRTSFLEATIAVKRPTGYGGDLCEAGSIEYVRFFLDYGSGWEDVGLAGVQVHDIPNQNDCAGQPEKPLTYVASLRIDAHSECCKHPVLPRVRAILSWQWMPPAGASNVNWKPVWGNDLETEIQIEPGPWTIKCLLEEVGVKVPPVFEQVQQQPIPLPDPQPLALAELAELYTTATKAKSGKSGASAQFAVEPHRFGLKALKPLLAPEAAVNLDLLSSSAASFEAIGVDLAGAIAELEQTSANVEYEELMCLGLDETTPERLVATLRIKRPEGYSGNLCEAGSQEYVAFWADWDDTCEWSYLGTAQVNVHDIAKTPAQGLSYSAILPVDLTYLRRVCSNPKIARVRAVLSWQIPPSTTDPNKLEYWGNRLDSHVQIAPGEELTPGQASAEIRNIGGIAIEEIDTGGNGMTLPQEVRFANYPAQAADSWGLQRECPFGGTVEIEGLFFPGYWYRVKVRRATDPVTVFTVLDKHFELERATTGYTMQTAVDGFFEYVEPLAYFTRILAEWDTSEDGLWEVQLDLATTYSEASIVGSTPWYSILIDNTAPAAPPALPPTINLEIGAGEDCKDVTEGATISGVFIADDEHFGGWGLSTEPNSATTPSNQPQPDPAIASTTSAPWPAGNGWTLNTASPVKMKPCGYVVRLEVSDRSIVDSEPGIHNWNAIEEGFCLRE